MRLEPSRSPERMVAFEVGGSLYALPIADVREVAEVGRIGCVPTLPPRIGGVMNHHGDALPLVYPAALLDLPGGELPRPEHVLVLGEGASDAGHLGLPVDHVLGLIDAVPPASRGPGVVLERRPQDGRVLGVLDTRRLLERAAEVIESSVGRASGAGAGGE